MGWVVGESGAGGPFVERVRGVAKLHLSFPTALLSPGCMEDLMSSLMTSPSSSCSQESSKGVGQEDQGGTLVLYWGDMPIWVIP